MGFGRHLTGLKRRQGALGLRIVVHEDQLTARQLAATDAALDWGALADALYAQDFDLRERGLILGDVRAWLGLP